MVAEHIDLASTIAGPVAVLGLGRSGLSAAKALQRAGIEVRAWDDLSHARDRAAADGMAIRDLRTEALDDVRLLVLSPGIPHTWPAPHPIVARARAADIEIVCDVDLLFRACPSAHFVGVTGTNGKSTTTALVGHILAASRPTEVGGNIGIPALDLVALDNRGTYVLELSSYQLELLPSASFETAVLLNISTDHTERHGSAAGYVAAKAHIFEGQDNDGTAVVGIDDESSRGLFEQLSNRRPGRVVAVSGHVAVGGGVFAEDGWLVDDRHGRAERVLDLNNVPTLPGRHNAQNVAAAYAAAGASGLTSVQIADRIPSFAGLPHRQEILGRVDGALYINDSKATNLAAVGNALSCYDDIIWIAGGRPKAGIDVAEIAVHFPRIRLACLIGEAAPLLAAGLDSSVPSKQCGDLATAVEVAAAAVSKAATKPVVLLSPACASFDQFDDFEQRGEAFRRLVGRLPGEHTRLAEGVAC